MWKTSIKYGNIVPPKSFFENNITPIPNLDNTFYEERKITNKYSS